MYHNLPPLPPPHSSNVSVPTRAPNDYSSLPPLPPHSPSPTQPVQQCSSPGPSFVHTQNLQNSTISNNHFTLIPAQPPQSACLTTPSKPDSSLPWPPTQSSSPPPQTPTQSSTESWPPTTPVQIPPTGHNHTVLPPLPPHSATPMQSIQQLPPVQPHSPELPPLPPHSASLGYSPSPPQTQTEIVEPQSRLSGSQPARPPQRPPSAPHNSQFPTLPPHSNQAQQRKSTPAPEKERGRSGGFFASIMPKRDRSPSPDIPTPSHPGGRSSNSLFADVIGWDPKKHVPPVKIEITKVEIRHDGKIGAQTYAIYEIQIEQEGVHWTIYRRYSQFYELDAKLKSHGLLSSKDDTLPPKTLMNQDNTDEEVLELRKKHLATYFNTVINGSTAVRQSQYVFNFVGPYQLGDIPPPDSDDDSY